MINKINKIDEERFKLIEYLIKERLNLRDCESNIYNKLYLLHGVRKNLVLSSKVTDNSYLGINYTPCLNTLTIGVNKDNLAQIYSLERIVENDYEYHLKLTYFEYEVRSKKCLYKDTLVNFKEDSLKLEYIEEILSRVKDIITEKKLAI